MGQPAHENIDPWTATNEVPIHKKPEWATTPPVEPTPVELEPIHRPDKESMSRLRRVGQFLMEGFIYYGHYSSIVGRTGMYIPPETKQTEEPEK